MRRDTGEPNPADWPWQAGAQSWQGNVVIHCPVGVRCPAARRVRSAGCRDSCNACDAKEGFRVKTDIEVRLVTRDPVLVLSRTRVEYVSAGCFPPNGQWTTDWLRAFDSVRIPADGRFSVLWLSLTRSRRRKVMSRRILRPTTTTGRR